MIAITINDKCVSFRGGNFYGMAATLVSISPVFLDFPLNRFYRNAQTDFSCLSIMLWQQDQAMRDGCILRGVVFVKFLKGEQCLGPRSRFA